MTPESQRIAIAEACGWRIKRIVPDVGHIRWSFEDPIGKLSIRDRYEMDGKVDWPDCLPNYLSDLNAMHEAEDVLSDEQYERFIGELLAVRTRDANALCKQSRPRDFTNTGATAAQRAEAFLRTLNLWTNP